jgi:hypothetical protein
MSSTENIFLANVFIGAKIINMCIFAKYIKYKIKGFQYERFS